MSANSLRLLLVPFLSWVCNPARAPRLALAMVFAPPQVLACVQLGSMALPASPVLLDILDQHAKLAPQVAHLVTMVLPAPAAVLLPS